MSRLVQNLVENAFKYTAEGGRVRVSLVSDGQTLSLSVADNGIGIDKKEPAPHLGALLAGGTARGAWTVARGWASRW